MQTTCGFCSGSGHVTCPGCGGKGYHGRLDGNMEFEMSPCAVCAGRKQIPCNVCHGRGEINLPDPPSGFNQKVKSEKKSSDILEGIWTTSGGSYEFIKEKDKYRVIENSALGKSGEGTATISGNNVTLSMNTKFLGSFTLELELNGDSLEGSISMMGFPVPFILYRG